MFTDSLLIAINQTIYLGLFIFLVDYSLSKQSAAVVSAANCINSRTLYVRLWMIMMPSLKMSSFQAHVMTGRQIIR